MTWLLDVSTLVARLVKSHEHHERVNVWWSGRRLAVCPIIELGFLRVASALGSTMEDARTVLGNFLREETPIFIPCDRRALESEAATPRKTTDMYLAELARSRGWRLATLDEDIAHSSVDVVPDVPFSEQP